MFFLCFGTGTRKFRTNEKQILGSFFRRPHFLFLPLPFDMTLSTLGETRKPEVSTKFKIIHQKDFMGVLSNCQSPSLSVVIF